MRSLAEILYFVELVFNLASFAAAQHETPKR